MVKLCENTHVYTQHVQFHETLKHLEKSEFQCVLPSASSQESSIHQLAQWSRLGGTWKTGSSSSLAVPDSGAQASAQFCLATELSPHCDSKGDVNTEEFNRQSSGQW